MRRQSRLKTALEKYWLKRQLRHVNAAFGIAQDQGVDAGLSFLDSRPLRTPKGIKSLIRANSASDERDLLDQLNNWGKSHQIPEMRLADKEGHLFSRLKFEPAAPVASSDLVSVIIPCFNAESDVAQAIGSIQEQTWQNIEIIAVNDKSSDNTGEVLERIAANEPRLRVLHNAVNVGP